MCYQKKFFCLLTQKNLLRDFLLLDDSLGKLTLKCGRYTLTSMNISDVEMFAILIQETN